MLVNLRRRYILWRAQLRIRSNQRMIDRYTAWMAKHPVKEDL